MSSSTNKSSTNEFFIPTDIINEIAKHAIPDDYEKLKKMEVALKNRADFCMDCIQFKCSDDISMCNICQKYTCDCYFCDSCNDLFSCYDCNKVKLYCSNECKYLCEPCAKELIYNCSHCGILICDECSCTCCKKKLCENCVDQFHKDCSDSNESSDSNDEDYEPRRTKNLMNKF